MRARHTAFCSVTQAVGTGETRRATRRQLATPGETCVLLPKRVDRQVRVDSRIGRDAVLRGTREDVGGALHGLGLREAAGGGDQARVDGRLAERRAATAQHVLDVVEGSRGKTEQYGL